MSLSKSNIEYMNFNWPIFPGCNHWTTGVCAVGENCWAKKEAHQHGRSFEPHLRADHLLDPLSRRQPAVIGVNFTGDLMGEWVDPDSDTGITAEWNLASYTHPYPLQEVVKDVMHQSPQHTYLFLTKAPQNIKQWGKWPDNAWLGVSVCRNTDLNGILDLRGAQATHKWLSFEPLLESLDYRWFADLIKESGISWVVIGAQSGRHPVQPKLEWVREIVAACDKAGIPVWLKNNLKPLLIPEDCKQPNGLMYDGFWANDKCQLRQERPFGRSK